MNNDAILASISKIHAYRYAKEKQRGVKLVGVFGKFAGYHI